MDGVSRYGTNTHNSSSISVVQMALEAIIFGRVGHADGMTRVMYIV